MPTVQELGAERARASSEGLAKRMLAAYLELYMLSVNDPEHAEAARQSLKVRARLIAAEVTPELDALMRKERGTRLYVLTADDEHLRALLSHGEMWEIPPERFDIAHERMARVPAEFRQAIQEFNQQMEQMQAASAGG